MPGTGSKALKDILAFQIPFTFQDPGIYDVGVEEDQAITSDYTPLNSAIFFDLPRAPELPFDASQHGQRDTGAEIRQRWRVNQGQTVIVLEANGFESASVSALRSNVLCAQIGDEVRFANGIVRMQIEILDSQRGGHIWVTQTAEAAGGSGFFRLAKDGHLAMPSDAACARRAGHRARHQAGYHRLREPGGLRAQRR